ncbi:MAG TPA: hypothetical protein PLM79_16735 [Syntrophobacteraceae bacterium]|nr:hypothetical protein [Syntrophobacteraceae bacterium]
MNALTFENLDLACAMAGKKIAAKPSKELENLVTNALAVSEDQGLYALFLFLKAQTEKNKEMAKGICDQLFTFLKETPQQAPLLSDNADVFISLQQTAKDLDKLLLARDLTRQALIYARYHARVIEESEVRK